MAKQKRQPLAEEEEAEEAEEVEEPKPKKKKKKQVPEEVQEAEEVVAGKKQKKKTVADNAEEELETLPKDQAKKAKAADGDKHGETAENTVESDSIGDSKGKGRGGRGIGTGDSKGKGRGSGKGRGGRGGTWSNQAFRVYISGLPESSAEERLREDFGECGEITDIYLPKDKETGKHRGFVFINFKDSNGVEEALKFDGDDYGGSWLRVKKAEEKGNGDGRSVNEKPAGCTSIVVKKLGPDVTQGDLEDFFADCGNGPTHVGLLLDATGRSRCTARVDFDDGDSIDEAMALTPEIKGRMFTMAYCKPKSWGGEEKTWGEEG
mmetsp:Transcript_70512/g.127158  ORF Transcript_70512/g.127158 Transcript_70512/m.127158 type:complete len:321 (+) Transcript_70512:76-1038(+)|eukprot:CAMPEP_0115082324 /NCGR_PEP_ID=MMETSP0227-20121206/19836_1 /TAXON_ID=89957 /ORGANISM="Polarella glacialis, Strain CCMP 1383" /LENGTH=320 /DNA_ID=CAMNT_0002470397 /DNA_START=47 /DNA_END=1009 /DNA_ORIENTATION=+